MNLKTEQEWCINERRVKIMEVIMSLLTYEAIVDNGHVYLDNLPFSNKSRIKIVVFPEADLNQMSFKKAQELTSGVKSNLSDEVNLERGER
jgi:hypothetical protein